VVNNITGSNKATTIHIPIRTHTLTSSRHKDRDKAAVNNIRLVITITRTHIISSIIQLQRPHQRLEAARAQRPPSTSSSSSRSSTLSARTTPSTSRSPKSARARSARSTRPGVERQMISSLSRKCSLRTKKKA
jgi:hypothetical protein